MLDAILVAENNMDVNRNFFFTYHYEYQKKVVFLWQIIHLINMSNER